MGGSEKKKKDKSQRGGPDGARVCKQVLLGSKLGITIYLVESVDEDGYLAVSRDGTRLEELIERAPCLSQEQIVSDVLSLSRSLFSCLVYVVVCSVSGSSPPSTLAHGSWLMA